MMDQPNFTRLFCQRPQLFAWFLGAGASRNANLPTAEDIVIDLKRRFYCSEENQQYSTKDLQNSFVRNIIENYCKTRGFPPHRSPEAYTTCFEKIFGENRERQRQYISAMLSEDGVKLAIGNRVMGAFLASGLCRLVFTTNFDSVVEKSVAEMSGKSLSVFQLENASGAIAALNSEEYPIYCKLHGDFRHESLKNLSSDLASQNEKLSQTLVNAATRFGFVVAGYSGRDASVMRLFSAALEATNAFPHGLYWLKTNNAKTPSSVAELVDKALAKGIEAHIVEIDTYDSALCRLWRNLSEKPEGLDAKVQKGKAATVSIPVPAKSNTGPLVRLNALPIVKLPTDCFMVKTKDVLDWKGLREILKDAETDIVTTIDGGVLAWGDTEEIESIFGSQFICAAAHRFDPDWRNSNRFVKKKFLEDALGRAFARTCPVHMRWRGSDVYLIVDKEAGDLESLNKLRQACGKITGTIPSFSIRGTPNFKAVFRVDFAEAAQISLAYGDDRMWLLIRPDVWIWPPRARPYATNWLDSRRSDRYNIRHDAILSAWVALLSDNAGRNKKFSVSLLDDDTSASNPTFELINRTGYAWKRGAT